jgi:hypothetical protein
MSSHLLRGLGAVALASGLMLGCAHTTYRAPAPTVANNGVALSVVSGQRCFVTRDSERLPPPTNDNRVHVRVTVQIENDSPGVVGVAPERVRLTAQERGPARTEIAPMGSAELSLQPGESRILPLDFAGPGPVACGQPLALDPRDALDVDGRSVVLPPVRLVAVR